MRDEGIRKIRMQEGCRKALSCRGIFGCLGWIVALLTMLVAGVCEYSSYLEDERDSRRWELRELFYEKLPLGTKMEVAIEFLRTLPGEVRDPRPVSEFLVDWPYSEEAVLYQYEEFPLLRASGGWYVGYAEKISAFELPPLLPWPFVYVYFFFDKDGKLVRKVFIP
jgi:hypothetical protein